MPKGDRLKLKADPEDGTTPIANLLLEAVAMAKISGLQKGAILYLWRRTYGWIEEGQRIKERKITLNEWRNALDSSSSRLSKALAELEAKEIIKRRMADAWGGYYYQINTDISKWNSNSINLPKLAERVGIVDFATLDQSTTVDQNATLDQSNNSDVKGNSSPKRNATVDQNATQQLTKTTPPLPLYKERLKKDKEIKDDKKISSPIGEKVKEVFFKIDKSRGYRPPKRKAEAASIIRMLKIYSPDEIINTYEILKVDKFWQDKELFMMTVESQIGAVLKTNDDNSQITGKYDHMVQR